MKNLQAVTSSGETVSAPANARVVDCDVREDLRTGREPFSRIMQAVDALAPGEVLRVRATFAPVPLIGLLAERGFVYQMESESDDDWSVWFWQVSSL
ncbi:MAG: DUF2249 domain-containing protein [Gemmatimonadota bacterium]|nr:DUF2249 domain-containing protein [Gemmatimonadota bacterium]HEU4988753.1 DUF2249 domain-containing protein [Gemmatimonadaceae bacterium]